VQYIMNCAKYMNVSCNSLVRGNVHVDMLFSAVH